MAGPQDDLTYLLTIDPADTTLDVDVTDYVQSFTMRKGRDRETDQYQPATGTLVLLDRDRRFDPHNDNGPYSPHSRYAATYGGLIPLRRMRVQLDSADVENYVELAHSGGASVNYVDTPDSAAVSVTGDLDVRWFGTLTDWDVGDQTLMSHWDTTGNQRSWRITANAGGLQLYVSTNGTNEFSSTAIPVPVADGAYLGIRFARVQATGVATLYTSTDDGETWTTQSPTTVLSAGTALKDSTAKVVIGAHSDGAASGANGKVLRAEVRSVIGGTIVASPTFNTLAAGRNLVWEPYTDAEGNVWTGRGTGSDTLVVAGSRIFTGFVDDWALECLEGDRMAVVTVPAVDGLGTLANCELDVIAAAHSLDTTGERIERVLALSEVDYTDPTSIDVGVSHLGDTTFGTNALQYLQQCVKAEGGYLFVDRNGTLQFLDRHTLLNDSTTAVTFTDAHVGGGIPYKRLLQSSAADLLYNRATGAGTSGLASSASDATSIAAFKTRTLPVGPLLVLNDAEVTSLLQWYVERFKDPEARFSAIQINTMALDDADAQTVALLDIGTLVTVERVPLGGVPEIRYVDTPGSASNYVSAPDAADLDIVGNICLVLRAAADDWTPAATQTILSKWTNTGNQRSYRLDLNTTGMIALFWSTTGADNPSCVSSVALASTAGVADGDWLWVAVAFDIDEGGNRVINFFYSTDPTDDAAAVHWTQLGASTPGGGAATSIFASTAPVNLSGHTLGVTQPFAGRYAYASIRQGVAAGTTVGGTEKLTFDGNVDLLNVVPTATSFTATTGETVTLNGTAAIGTQDPDTITRTCIVDGIEHTITPGSWETVIRLGNADTRPFLVLDHPTFGKLNSNRIAF